MLGTGARGRAPLLTRGQRPLLGRHRTRESGRVLRPVTLTITSGTTPTFAWTPRCRLFFLVVEPAESGADLWSIITRSENGLAPPVTYGTVPSGAEETVSPVVLQAGVAYKVAVARWTGPGDDDGETVGGHPFTP